jgi:hypothetical protein
MAKRAAPGNRDRLEAALSPTLLAALEEMRVLFDVWDWQETPLAPGFQFAAAVLRAAELVGDGMAATAALDMAATELGLSHDTVRSWARRWSKASRAKVQHARAGRGATTVSLVVDMQHPKPKQRAA